VSVRKVLRLRRDATVSTPVAGAVRLEFPGGQAVWRGLPAGVCAAVGALAGGDHTEVELGVLVSGGDGLAGLGVLHRILRQLDGSSMLEHAVLDGGRELARLRPTGRGRLARERPEGRVRLSRFAVARAEGGVIVLAAPASHLAVELADTAILARLAGWTSYDPDDAVLGLLADAGLLVGDDAETGTAERAQWSVPDLWLHARSRGTRFSAGYGGGYPLADRFPPLPAVPAPRPVRIPLPVPDLAVAAKLDPPLTEVLESRRSVREHDATAPISLTDLAELLYRSARNRGTFAGEHGMELVDRPYPAGGSIHELELYPLVTDCVGLEPGLYHYAGADHHLELVAPPGPATRTLLDQARAASTMSADPQVLLTVTARFGRLMWKYDTIAYALLLKHVGVLYQTIYLVGTAMGLAVCGLGGGDAGDFATASGLDPYAEGSVGELVLGSRR
jgi:oxazoline/thiazoline dehydrogenase